LEGFAKIAKEDKNDGNATERLKALTRNKTTANFNTIRKQKDEEEKGKDSEKTVNQSMQKSKKDLHAITETSIFLPIYCF
jgi:predicted kinase